MMKYSRLSCLFFLLLSICLQSNAQSLDVSPYRPIHLEYTAFAAILHNGKALIKDNTPDGPLRFEMGMVGKLTLGVVDRKTKAALPNSNIGFKIGIKDKDTNTIWMYSEKTYYEVELEDLLEKCDRGDSVIFMTVDRKYQLSRNEMIIMPGC